MILTDEHLAQMRATVERARAERQSPVYITPDALEALLDRVQAAETRIRGYSDDPDYPQYSYIEPSTNVTFNNCWSFKPCACSNASMIK